MNIIEELDEKFAQLDDKSKLMATLSILSKCACAHRRILGLHQLKHAHDYIVSDDARRVAEATDPVVAAKVAEITGHMERLAADPADCHEADLAPRGAGTTRDFLWSDALEEPVWYDVRHAAREGLGIVEAQVLQRA
ncbi:MAG TPA: hypothetical protein VH834_19325 [Solirubrobacteraceae bacterium]|jgi:hypothetical protein